MFGDFQILKKCAKTNARVSTFELSNNTLSLPVFMPVATYGAMRGVQPEYLSEEIILSNTYHLRNLKRNIKKLMGWNKAMLTDSGGFQIQSLPDVKVVDAGVSFGGKLFTPEQSMEAQMVLGADIMMQLDDVVNPKEPRELHVTAVKRSLEWLRRAVEYINSAIDREAREEEEAQNKVRKRHCHIRAANGQMLFPIIQGGLLEDLRKESIDGILEFEPMGLAIGGLSGGESKKDFCRIVHYCCKNLPDCMPRYLMGVGYPEDIVVCHALGVDMSDCVYPTRTARFGRAFLDAGDKIINNSVLYNTAPIDPECECATCKRYSQAYLALLRGTPNFCTLMSIHNLHYMRNLTQRVRDSIINDHFDVFLKEYLTRRFGGAVPEWIHYALKLVSVEIK